MSVEASTTPIPAVAAGPAPAAATENGQSNLSTTAAPSDPTQTESPKSASPPKTSLETFSKHSADPTTEFIGDIDTNNTIPSQAVLKGIEDYPVLDKDGRSRPFKSVYTGPNVPRRVLIIFIRHFFCGNCQEYLRTLSASITSDSLLQLPIPTFIAVIGCGSPSLIPMYTAATSCPFPIYADPTKKLYHELGMVRTLALGPRPEYQRKSMAANILHSVVQGLKQIPSGRVLAGGDYQQVGGEFLFEPVGDLRSPVAGTELGREEEKRVTWCHRMRNTRDHAEVPELREVLGFEGVGVPGGNERRWSRAVNQRKGTGLSAMSGLREDEEGVLTEEPKPVLSTGN